MAAATTLKAGLLRVYLEDTATPGTWVSPCGLVERGFTISKDVTDSITPDCLDPDAPAWVGRDVASQSAAISGSGVLALESFPEWQAFSNTTVARNVRVEVFTAAGLGGGYWQFAGHLSSLEVTGNNGEKIQVSISIDSDGPVAWTAF